MSVVAEAGDVETAIDAMTTYVGEVASGRPQRVGVGDALAPALADEYEARLRELSEVVDSSCGTRSGLRSARTPDAAPWAPASSPRPDRKPSTGASRASAVVPPS